MSSTEESKNRMNLAAIKKVDPYAKDIVDTSSHVAFYTFNSEQNEWEKTDVEGAFFVYSRNAEPFHSIFINNRLNTTTCVEPITGHLELQSQPPFLLYRNERSRIRGFWFYNSDECNRISILIGNLVQQLATENQKLQDQQQQHQQQHQQQQYQKKKLETADEVQKRKQENINLFRMLSNAQQEFNNAKLNSNNNNSSSNFGNHLQQQPPGLQIQPQQQHQQQNPSQANDAPSNNVLEFFAALEAKPKTAELPIFKRLLPVDEIEKQQRTKTPMDDSSQKKSLPRMQQQHQQQQQQQQQQQLIDIVYLKKPQQAISTTLTGTTANTNSDGGLNALLQANVKTESSSNELAKFFNSVDLNNSNSSACSGGVVGAVPAKFQPSTAETMTHNDTSLRKLLTVNAVSPSNSILHMDTIQLTKETTNKPALMPPTMFDKPKGGISSNALSQLCVNNSATNNILNNLTRPEPLNSTQLVQAFSYLLQNDDDFVQKLHEAYLKTFTKTILGSSAANHHQ